MRFGNQLQSYINPANIASAYSMGADEYAMQMIRNSNSFGLTTGQGFESFKNSVIEEINSILEEKNMLQCT